MKPLITGSALVIVFIIVFSFQTDNYEYRLNTKKLKNCSDEAAYSASLYYNQVEKSNGKTVFLEDDGIKAIEHVIKSWLKLDENLMPTNESYWTDAISYKAYFYDDDLRCNVYINGIRSPSEEFDFVYPFLHEDDELDYVKTIGNANVIVKINAGKAKFTLDFIVEPVVIRTSSYEYSN